MCIRDSSWGASDFLAVLPDSTSYSGYTAIAPPMYRVSVAIYLGINLLELDQGTARRCPCDEACRPLDSAIGLDVLLGCNRAGHAFTLSRRHDFWVCTWGAFLSAHGVRAAERSRAYTSPALRRAASARITSSSATTAASRGSTS